MRRTPVTALVLFAVLSLILTFPLPLHLANAVEDRQDALLNVWITAWDGHQLLSDPAHLFDANIFYPYARTLAYSELLLGNALLALPLTAATGNPVLGYNVALLLSFILSGLGAYLWVLRLTRSPAAGLASGAVFAFASYRLTNLAQAQLLTTQWMPFALLSLYELMRRPRPRHAVLLGLFFCLQALSSFYYAILLGLAVVVVGIGYWIAGVRPSSNSGRRSLAVHVLVVAACCGLILLPFVLPYVRVQQELGFERTLADSEPFSASLRQYLMVPPGSVVHGRWLPSDDTPVAGGYAVDALFPGLVALGLAAWGLVRGKGRLRWVVVALLLVSFLLSLGPRLYLAPGQPAGLDMALPYAWLYTIVPGFRALRAPVRFDALVTLSLAVLTGYGVAALRGKGGEMGGRKEWGRLLVSPIWVLICLESLVWPAAKVEEVPVGAAVPPVYRWLEEQAPAPILELPMAFTPGGPQLETQYLSVYHWQTTPDGYSGFIPPKHGQIVYEMERFPSERSVSLLQALGVQTVVIHPDRIAARRWQEMQEALAEADDLVQVATLGEDKVYQVQPRSFDAGALKVSGYFPAHAVAGQPVLAYAIVVNDGAQSYAIQPTDVIQAQVTWRGSEGDVTDHVTSDVPLVISPGGGAAVIPLSLPAPTIPGMYKVDISEEDGPLGGWSLSGTVELGEQGEPAFPVPARLEEWEVPAVAHPGERLAVRLIWRALGKIDAYYSVYVKMLDGEGNTVAGWDGQPRDGEAPTLLWAPGERVDDVVTLVVPVETPAGEYVVEAGMYRAEDLARCLTLNPDGVPVEQVALGRVRVGP